MNDGGYPFPRKHIEHALAIQQISLNQGRTLRDGAPMTLGKVIQDNHRMSCFEQPVRNHAPDVARPARNQYSPIASVSKRRARRLPHLESFIFWIECCSTNNTQ
jgi:hypothetical protein